MAVEITPLGFQKPDGNEPIKQGDNVIAANAQTAEELHQTGRARLAQLENAAGFPGAPLDFADDVVSGLVTGPTDTRTALDARFPLKADMTAKLDKTEAATTYAAKSVETTKLDKTEAASTYATTSTVTAQVQSEVPPAVSATIANDPTVAQNAATLAQSTAGLATHFQGSAPVSDVAGGIVDKVRKETWLGFALDGGPTEYAKKRLGIRKIANATIGGGFLDSEGRRTELVHDNAGRVPQDVLSAWLRRFSPQRTATRTVWGHSLARGTAGGASAWAPMLEAKLGYPVINRGASGAWSKHVAAMQGGKHALVTVSGGSIPASGPVNVFMDTNFMFGDIGPTHQVTIAGIPGTLTLVAANNAGADCTFTRATAGTVTPVPDTSPMVMAIGDTARQDIIYLWALKNDIGKPGVTMDDAIENLARMVHRVEAVTKKILIFEEPPSSGETLGSADRATLDQWNAAVRQLFPQYWVPVMSWLRTPEAAVAAGVTFTAQDNTDIANGVTPTTFRVDGLHLSTAGNTAIAQRAYLEELHRGWI